MFQAVAPPIIRNSKLYTQYQVFVELFLLLTAIVSELELVVQIFQINIFYKLLKILIILHFFLTSNYPGLADP